MEFTMSEVAKTQDRTPTAADDPLYLKLVHLLRQELQSGRYPPGSRLPSEGELSRQHSVSRHTVREALRRLREDGLVTPRKGAGTVVVGREATPQYVQQIVSVEQLLEYAADVPLEVITSKPVRAGRALAQKLDCPEGEEWMLVAGLRYAPGQALPICWTDVYVLAEYADMPRMVGQRVGPIYTWIERQHGQVITDIEQVLTAHEVPARVAAKLGVKPGSIGVEVRRTFRLGSGKVAQIAINLHPADRFRYSVTLKRARAS
jgi:GntR family transcriptional regulator